MKKFLKKRLEKSKKICLLVKYLHTNKYLIYYKCINMVKEESKIKNERGLKNLICEQLDITLQQLFSMVLGIYQNVIFN